MHENVQPPLRYWDKHKIWQPCWFVQMLSQPGNMLNRRMSRAHVRAFWISLYIPLSFHNALLHCLVHHTGQVVMAGAVSQIAKALGSTSIRYRSGEPQRVILLFMVNVVALCFCVLSYQCTLLCTQTSYIHCLQTRGLSRHILSYIIYTT